MNEAPFVPGVFFIITALIAFRVLRISVSARNLFFYCLLMYLVYLIVFWGTFYTIAYDLPPAGVIVCGLGAIAAFGLTSLFIRKIKFNYFVVFLVGAISFLENYFAEIFLPPSQTHPDIFAIPDVGISFAITFFIWQFGIGTLLGLSLLKFQLNSAGYKKQMLVSE